VLIAAAAATSCTRPGEAPGASTLRVAFGIGPTVKASGVDTIAGLLFNEPLIAHDSRGRPQPGLAEAWAWESNGRLLRIELKKGVRFHDGSTLTAPLVQRFLAAFAKGPASDRPLGLQRVTGIEATGEHSLAISLSRPDLFLLTELNELRVVHPDNPDVGTGPFRLVRLQPIAEAERFDGYHGGMPGSSRVQIVPYDSQRSAWAALMRGEADAAQEITRDAVDFMERSSHVVTHSSTQPFYIPVVFNHNHAAFTNPIVRRAIDLALDRAGIVERAMLGRGIAAHGPIWRDHWAYDPPAGPPGFDPVQAAGLLDSAGFPLRPAMNGQPGSRFAFRCLFWSEDPQYERIALMVQRQLSDIGIEVELEPVTLRDLALKASRGDFDAFLARANAGRSLMFTYRFWRSASSSDDVFWRTGYTGVDAELDRLRDSTTDTQVRDAIAALSARFREDAPAAFIAWTEVTRAISSDISVNAEGADPFMSIWKWRRGGARGTYP